MFRLTVAALCVGMAASTAFAQGRGGVGSSSDEFGQALAAAQAQVPGATLLRSRLEQAGTVFGFYFWVNGKIVELEFKRAGLKQIKSKSVALGAAGDDSGVSRDIIALLEKNSKEGIKLPEGRLLELAADGLRGQTFSDVRLSTVDGRLAMKFDEVAIDASNGKRVETKAVKK